jgi:phosphate transport system substrate-binding protein
MKFFDWAYKNGDAAATTLEYIPLPDAVKTAVRAAWHANIVAPGGKPIN